MSDRDERVGACKMRCFRCRRWHPGVDEDEDGQCIDCKLEAWSGIDRGVAPPLEYRPLPPITEQQIRDAAARMLRWHQVFDGGELRGCYCADGKHGR